MAIIAYSSKGKKEVGQTRGMAAVITYMAIKHNCKILGIETGFGDNELEKCFWEIENKKVQNPNIMQGNIQVGLENGVEDLIRTITSNKITPETVSNYAKIVFKNRLDILLAPKTKIKEEYTNILPYYIEILKLANKYYDFVFIDLDRDIPNSILQEILKIADVVAVNVKQSMDSINDIVDLKQSGGWASLNNPIIILQNTDMKSKYNKRNVTRYLKERTMISVVPHNTLFFEACDESKISEFFLKVRLNDNTMNKNSIFAREIDNIVQEILIRTN
ncbi:MAG: hypothetical protein Q4G05_00985 [Clostridia bacterium]|nr:hypothetical protein [Clostridia bacterium]